MTTKLDLIISIILLILLSIYKIIESKKNKIVYKSELYNKSKKLIKIFTILSIIIFIIAFIINILIFNHNPSNKEVITYLINALSIAILVFPISLINLYNTSFKDEEKYSHIKTIITNQLDNKLIKKFKKAGINTIILNSNTKDNKITKITKKDINKQVLKKTIIIQTDELDILDNLINKTNTIKKFDNLEELFNKIYTSRGIHDNYIRSIKYLIITYSSLIISYLFLNIMGFPTIQNLLLALILKTITIITTNFVYKKMPYDTDIMIRKVKEINILIGKQELLLTTLTSFIVAFIINIPYMFVLAQGASISFANTLYILLFIYSNLFITISLLSESNIFKNMFISLKNIRIILFILFCIIITIVVNKTAYFNTRNIEISNTISCIIFGFISCLFNELSKLARFTTMRGVNKNGIKNNKKYK